MEKKQYKIRIKVSFSGTVTVQAHDRKEAEAITEKDFAAQLGQVEALNERIKDWDVDLKGVTIVNRRKEEA